jgi:hypothetical protein
MKIFRNHLGRGVLMAGVVALTVLVGFLGTARAVTTANERPVMPPSTSGRQGGSSSAPDPANIDPLTGHPYATTATSSQPYPASMAADPDPTAQGHLATARKALERAQSALNKAEDNNHSEYVEKAQAAVTQALADEADASDYVTAHPPSNMLSLNAGAGDPPNAHLATISSNIQDPDANLKAALDALNVALNELLNNHGASARGPAPRLTSMGGSREKIIADIGRASTAVIVGLTAPPTEKSVAASSDQPAATTDKPTATPEVKSGPLPADVLDAVVIIRGDEALGTGFIVKMKGQFFIVTNQHVLSGQSPSKITIKGVDGTQYPLTNEVYGARDYDVAIIKIPTPAHYLEVMEDTHVGAKTGDTVTVPGNAGGAGVITQVDGQVLGIGPDLVEVDAKFIPGNSGSPIIHRDSGKVIGVATYAIVYTLDELKKAADQRSVRWFGYRLDNITTWDKLDLNRFNEEGKKIEAMESLTAGFIDLLSDKETDNPKILDTIKQYVIDRNKAQSRSDAITAVQSFANNLQALSDSDIRALAHTTLYPFHARRLAEEKEVRAEISKALTDEQQILDSVH